MPPDRDCPTCGMTRREAVSAGGAADEIPGSGPVYAVGRLTARFPTIGVEREFAQLAGGLGPSALVEVDQLKALLRDPENGYLGRHVCWVFVTQHVETFIVVPRDATDIVQLVDALAPGSEENVIQAVVGGPPLLPPPPACLGTGMILVAPEQVLSFTLDAFTQAMPQPDGDASAFRSVVGDVFQRFTRRSDNRGVADEHRALNYLALRYPPVYQTAFQMLTDGKALVGVDARHAHSADRRLVAVRLTFRSRRTEVVERYRCLVDVTEVFPFLVSPLSLTYD